MFVKILLVKGFRYLNYFWWVLLLRQDSSPVLRKEAVPPLGAEQGGEALWEHGGVSEDGVSPGRDDMECWLFPKGSATFPSSSTGGSSRVPSGSGEGELLRVPQPCLARGVPVTGPVVPAVPGGV